MPDFLTLKEASKHTGYHQDYLGQLIRTGKIQARRVGKSWLVSRQSLASYLADNGKLPVNKELFPSNTSKTTLSSANLRLRRSTMVAVLIAGILFSATAFSGGIPSWQKIYELLPAGLRFANFTKQINYQGKMRSVSTNQAVTDNDYSVVFRLYTTLTGGSAIWTETQTVHTKNGLFSVPLGSVTSLENINLNQSLYLSVQVGTDAEMSPRKLLGAVPSAIVAEQLNGHYIDEFVLNNSTSTMSTSSAQTVLVINQTGTGNLFDAQKSGVSKLLVDENGNVGIGTTSPTNKLEVNGNGYFNGPLIAANMTATGTLAVSGKTTLANASTTNLSVSGKTFLSGYVGVGLTNPSTALTVNGTASTTGLQVTGNANITGVLTLDNALAVSEGGTGATSFTSNGIIFGSSTLKSTGAGSAGQILQAKTNGEPNFVSLYGDIDVAVGGDVTINNGVVSLSKMANLMYGDIIGRSDNSTGVPQSISTSTYKTMLSLNTNDLNEGTNLFWTNDRFDTRLVATTSLLKLSTLAGLATIGSSTGVTTILGRTVITNASTTNVSVSGQTYLTGLLTGVNATLSGTLGVTGKTTLGVASSTALTVSGTVYAGNFVATNAFATSTLAGGLEVDGSAIVGNTYTTTANDGLLRLNYNSDTVAALKIGSDNFGWKWYYDTAGKLRLVREVSDVESEVISFNRDNGYIGVGTTSPDGPFEVAKNQNSQTTAYLTNNNPGAAAYAELNIRNGGGTTGADGLRLLTMGTGWTTAGAYVRDAGVVAAGANLSGGLSLVAQGTTGVMRFYTGGYTDSYERMRIDADGNVGIGVATPATTLEVSSTTGAILRLSSSDVAFAGGDIAGALQFYTKDASDSGAIVAGEMKYIGTTWDGITHDGRLGFFTVPSTVAGGIDTIERMTILNGGNVGIGTASPVETLDVVGTKANVGTYNLGMMNVSDDAAMAANVGGAITLRGNYVTGTNNPTVGATISAYKINSTSGDYSFGLQLSTRNSGGSPLPRLTIDNTGDVGIGVTAPAQTLDMKAGGTYGYNGVILAQASTTLNNYFFGNAGNLTATGTNNVALGHTALGEDYTGYQNTAVGNFALAVNDSGFRNTAHGYTALTSNTTGINNSALGAFALYSNNIGSNNVAMGLAALYGTTGSSYTTAVGFEAGRRKADNSALATSSYSVYLGANTKALSENDTNSIVIGYLANGLGSNTVVLGNDSITTTALKGSVGIGLTNPSTALSVDGVASSTGLQVNGNATITGNLNLSADLALASGGTGRSTFTTYGVVFGSSTTALESTAAGTAGQLLIAGPAGVPDFVSMFGDATLSSSGSLTIVASTLSGLATIGSTTGKTTLQGQAVFTNASTTNISVSGQTNLTGLLTGVNATLSGTLNVTGKTTLGLASTTNISVSGQTYLTGLLKGVNAIFSGNSTTTGVSYATTRQGGAIDVAEWIKYEGDQKPVAGEVIIASGNQKVSLTDQPYDSRAIGIVSTQPHLTMGSEYEGEDAVKLALAGRVPVKVSTENGEIQAGDLLTTSALKGYAMKATSKTTGVVAVALESLSTDQATGTVLSLISLNSNIDNSTKVSSATDPSILSDYIANGEVGINDIWTIDQETRQIKTFASLDLNNYDLNNVRSIKSAVGSWSLSEEGRLVVSEIQTDKLSADQGMTTKDKVTGEYYCLYVAEGSVKSEKGRCEEILGGTSETSSISEPANSPASPADDSAPVDTVAGNEQETPAAPTEIISNPAPVVETADLSEPSAPAPETISSDLVDIPAPTSIDTSYPDSTGV